MPEVNKKGIWLQKSNPDVWLKELVILINVVPEMSNYSF